MSFLKDSQPGNAIGSIALRQAFSIGQESSCVVAETPAPRSVAVAASRGPSLLAGPPSGIAKPSPVFGSERSPLLSRGCSRGSVGLTQEWDEIVVPSTSWCVANDDLEGIPEDFPLERTHRVIDGVEAQVVASRISEALRAHSIEASFKSKPPKAKCKTRDFVSFRVRLYACSEGGDPVVVEVQRRSGPTSCFMHICRAILDSAEGKEVGSSRKPPHFAKIPLGEMKCLEGILKPEDEVELATSALHDSMAMIRSKKRDTNLLGLENLCVLTDPIKTTPAVSLEISKTVVLGAENDIREEIMLLIERDVFAPDVAEDIALCHHVELRRQYALAAFANCLSLSSKDGCLGSAFVEQLWVRESLVPTLLDELRRVESNACNATQAVMCIHSLACSSSTARQFLIDQGILEQLRQANKYGSACNELLASETERCMKVLV